jgi:hypothetical protein
VIQHTAWWKARSWSSVSSTTAAEDAFPVRVLQRRSSCVRYVPKLYSSGLPACTLHVLSCFHVKLVTEMSNVLTVRTNILAERGMIRMVYQFGNRLKLIVVRISVNDGSRKSRIFFILDSRITSTLQRLTLPCGIPAAGHCVDSIYPRIEDNKYKI